MTRPRSSRNTAGPHRPNTVKAIPPGQMWPISFLHSRCGYGARARSAAIAAGLPVHRWQRRAWIFTSDLIDFLRTNGGRQTSAETTL